MKYRMILSSLRTFLAGRPITVFGTIVHDIIQDKYIPFLQAKLRRETNPAKIAELEKVIDDWEQASKKDSFWQKEFSSAVNYNIYRTSFDRTKVEDAVQEIAMMFYQDVRLKRAVDGFKPENGPAQFRTFMVSVISNVTKDFVRKELRRRKDEIEVEEMPEQPVYSPPVEPDEIFAKRMWKDINRELLLRFRDPLDKAIINRWFDVFNRKGFENINIRNDLTVPISRELGISPTNVDLRLLNIRKAIADLIEKKATINLPSWQRKKMKLASILAEELYRHEVSKWLLSGIK